MANAFVPDEKRRHQYLPINEDPPDYDIALDRNDIEAGPSRGRPRLSRPGRTSVSNVAADALDELPSDPDGQEDEDIGHDAADHRANSEDSSIHEFHELELETEPTKDPIHIRLTREIQRITARVDKVLYTYVNPTVMRYFYGALLGLIVVLLVYTFGGSIPRLKLAQRYQEDALRVYINEEMSAENIMRFTQEAQTVYEKHHSVEALFDSSKLANWVHDEFVNFRVARNAIDNFYVYYPRPQPDGQILEIQSAQGDKYAAPLVDEHGRLRAYITHGFSGNVTAPLVFANYGSIRDYEWLQSSGVIVEGSIVMFKRSPSIDLGTQIYTAELAGVLGCVIYSSPADYGSGQGETFPDGPYMPKDAASNVDAAFSWMQPGDVVTPGWPSTEMTKILDPDSVAALPRVPAVSISSNDAEQFLSFLQDTGVPMPEDWIVTQVASTKFFTGSNIPGASHLTLSSLLDEDRKHPIFDVLSEIEGNESDQVLVVGTSLSSLSSVAILLEVARIYAELVTKYAWAPRRSLIFAVWDATDQNYMGSTEWVEIQLKSLRAQGVAYINLMDAASLSADLDVRATPSLSKAILQAMSHVQNRYGNATVAYDQQLNILSDLPGPKHFSDSIAFQAHVGNAVADLGYAKTPVSSQCARSASCINEFLDPNFENHLILAKVFAMTILELVDERFIPLDLHAYARSIEAEIQALARKYPQLNFGGDLNKVMQQFDYQTDMTMRFLEEWSTAFVENKEMEPPNMSLKRSNWNYAVTTFHRNLLRSTGWTTWFENPVYGPSQQTDKDGQRSWLFPHLEDVISTLR